MSGGGLPSVASSGSSCEGVLRTKNIENVTMSDVLPGLRYARAFKSHVRSQIEWCNIAIFSAAPSKLAWLDTIQFAFLQHLDVGEH